MGVGQGSRSSEQPVTLQPQSGRGKQWRLFFSHLPPLCEVQNCCLGNGSVGPPNQPNPLTGLPRFPYKAACLLELDAVELILRHSWPLEEAACTGRPRSWKNGSRVQIQMCLFTSAQPWQFDPSFMTSKTSSALHIGNYFKD